MNNRNRIVNPFEGKKQSMSMPQYSAEDIRMMKHQGLSQMWAQYAELVRGSDIEGKEELAAAANTRAAEHLKTVIDGAEKLLKGGEDASKR
jgi:hypothetical protein